MKPGTLMTFCICISFILANLRLKTPPKLEFSASILDPFLEIDKDEQLKTKVFEKRDGFNFPSINFPFMGRNVPTALAYGVYRSHLIRLAEHALVMMISLGEESHSLANYPSRDMWKRG